MSKIIGDAIVVRGGGVNPPSASTTAKSGVTYTDGLSGLEPSDISLIAQTISNNGQITNTTMAVYYDYKKIHRKISIADQVTIPLNGTDYAFDVIGFNHDTLSNSAPYGEPTATGKAGITFQMHDCFETPYEMNSTDTNSGGWKNSAMRTSTMETMYGHLPALWQAFIMPVNKASGAGGGSSSGTETVSDSCFLLAEIEVFGSTSYSVSGEGTQYAYYKAGNSKMKRRDDLADTWWERSSMSGNKYGFCLVNSSGISYNRGAGSVYGVAFGFCV